MYILFALRLHCIRSRYTRCFANASAMSYNGNRGETIHP